ncbi:hypothetical protein HHI36_004969, partial [Cryptolaemus montrouzieri]
HCRAESFADNIQLYFSFESAQAAQAEVSVSGDLDGIVHYSSNHNLKPNPTKCNLIIFSSKSKESITNENLKIILCVIELEVKESAKSLGIVSENMIFALGLMFLSWCKEVIWL